MARQGFGTMGGFGAEEFDAVARQYWNAWGEMMRGASASATPNRTVPGWDEAVRWWSQLAQGGSTPANDAIGRFSAQAQGWFGQMQQLAAQFAGQDADAGEIAKVWKQMLGSGSTNPFADVFRQARGPGQHDLEAWMEQARPFLELLQRGRERWLDVPAFGFAREHQERWQAAAKAQDEYQAASQAFNNLLAESAQGAFDRFEQRLAEHSEPGRQLASARALFDLWIDAAEDAYAELALSQRFRDAYGHLANAQMRVRQHVQDEIERASSLLGVPGRTEVDAAHRKIVQLEREVRRLRDVVSAMAPMQGAGAPTAGLGTQTRAASPKSSATQASSTQRKSAGSAPARSAGSGPTKPAKRPAAATGKPAVRAARADKGGARSASAQRVTGKAGVGKSTRGAR